MRRPHLAVVIALITLGSVSLAAAPQGSVSGVVRDSSGVPQIGAIVQLLRPDFSVILAVYTDNKGEFSFPAIEPGRYALKAMNMSFLPSVRENVHVHRATVVNLTLSTLYEVMQWLPAEPRAANAKKDDWAWTLRSEANRPLLRWLEDGPLVVVSDGSGAAPKLKARLMATGEEGTFGESGERITAAVQNTPSNSRELLARVDFAPNTDAAMESMLGFSQDLGFAGSVQSVAAVAVHPDIADNTGAENLTEAAVRSWETINLGDEFDGEAGAEQLIARFVQDSPNTILAAMPFASFGWHDGNSVIRYRMTTFVPAPANADESQASTYLPQLSERNGKLALEHGLHQEVGWERQTSTSRMSVGFYSDNLQNPVMEAAAQFAANAAHTGFLFDPASGILRVSGPDFATVGMTASVERNIPGGNHVRLAYANGNALVVSALPHAVPIAQIISATHPRRVQTYTLSLSGTIEGTGTRWHASYRWQPSDTMTQVASFASDADQPFLSLHFRQPICAHRDGSSGVEAILDVRNLLAEGYRPFMLSDGSVLIFAQSQRGIRGGVAFTF